MIANRVIQMVLLFLPKRSLNYLLRINEGDWDMKVSIKLLLLLLFCSISNFLQAEWSSIFHKKFTEHEVGCAERDNALYFMKEGVSTFTQLLCSWNALRPSKGHLTFYVQARDAHTQKWGSWHRMNEWGKQVQQSYATKSDGFSKFVHVRLETEPLQLADAFCVKVVGAKGASLKNVKGLAVTVVNMNEFQPELVTPALAALQSVHIKRVPRISQFALKLPESKRICSPVSCAMLTQYLSDTPINPVKFATLSFDKGLNAYGSWPFNMAHAFECCKGKNWFYNTRLNSFAELHQQLKRGIPTVVSVRGELLGAAKPFPQGHLLLLIGWDQNSQEVLCHDPGVMEHQLVFKRYKLSSFLTSWERSRRLTYWVEPA